MELGIHFYSYEEYEMHSNDADPKWVFIGNYGCPYKSLTFETLLKLHEVVKSKGQKLHYISPKVTEAYIESEKAKVERLLENDISVSINDWGLFYLLRPFIKSKKSNVYIGRLLNKSIGDWVWGHSLFERENKESAEYLRQNNFNHDIKISYFIDSGISGIEVNAGLHSESSFRSISEKGMKIIGYADNKILAISRSCPIRRLNGYECSELCKKRLKLVPISNPTNDYPEMQLQGNTIVQPSENIFNWGGYEKIVYSCV